MFIEVVSYRREVASVSRGSTYFMQKVSKYVSEEKMSDMFRLSNTYFKMTH